MNDWESLEIIDDDECSSDCSECERCYYCDIDLQYEDEVFEDDEAVDRQYCHRCWTEIHHDDIID